MPTTKYSFRIGDEVIVQSNGFEYANKVFPNGTKVKVVGYNEYHISHIYPYGCKPGIYHQMVLPKVEDETGRQDYINENYLQPSSGSKVSHEVPTDTLFIRDLPETKFLPFDVVEMNFSGQRHVVTIRDISYHNVGSVCRDGTPWPIYNVDFDNRGGSTSAGDDDLTLVSRGNLWRKLNNEALVFGDLKEEADFYLKLGEGTEVRNPRNNYYSWHMDEALETIRRGDGHVIKVAQGMFTNNKGITVYRFNNEEFGERARQATIEGFEFF